MHRFQSLGLLSPPLYLLFRFLCFSGRSRSPLPCGKRVCSVQELNLLLEWIYNERPQNWEEYYRELLYQIGDSRFDAVIPSISLRIRTTSLIQ